MTIASYLVKWININNIKLKMQYATDIIMLILLIGVVTLSILRMKNNKNK